MESSRRYLYMARKAIAAAALALLALALPSGAAASSPLIAPASVCPNQSALAAPPATQEQTMLCLTNFAREQFGEAPFSPAPELEESARAKARDLLRCDEFSHYACGREFAYWIHASGYLSTPCWRDGENLAWGAGAYGSVGSIFRGLMRSTTHRENILGDFEEIGIDLSAGNLEGRPGSRVWAQHFGSHC
jgi:uncharacterized protein YkwD